MYAGQQTAAKVIRRGGPACGNFVDNFENNLLGTIEWLVNKKLNNKQCN